MAYNEKTIIPAVWKHLRKHYPLRKEGGNWSVLARAQACGYVPKDPDKPGPNVWFNNFLCVGNTDYDIPEQILTAMGLRCVKVKTPIKKKYVKITGD